jgi:hypothetical protein
MRPTNPEVSSISIGNKGIVVNSAYYYAHSKTPGRFWTTTRDARMRLARA